MAGFVYGTKLKHWVLDGAQMGFPALLGIPRSATLLEVKTALLVWSKSMRGQDLVIARVEISNLLDNLVERNAFSGPIVADTHKGGQIFSQRAYLTKTHRRFRSIVKIIAERLAVSGWVKIPWEG